LVLLERTVEARMTDRRLFMNGGSLNTCVHPECGEKFVSTPWYGRDGAKTYCCRAHRADMSDEPTLEDLARLQ